MKLRFRQRGGSIAFSIAPGQSLTVGRSLSSDIRLIHPTIGHRQARLIHDGGGCVLEGVGWPPRAWVNGELVEDERVLRLGDRIALGSMEFVLELDLEALLAAV